MQTLSKGANAALTASAVQVQVRCSSPIDVSALLLDVQGRVRDDNDMIFYNHPLGPGVSHHRASGPAPDTITVTFDELPSAVDKVVVTASLDGPGTFGAVASLTARVVDETGRAAVEFPVADLGAERALVCLELYRRAGQWKVRAVGQGYASGLAGIATDFGITVDDPGQPDATPTASRPAPGPTPAAQAAPASRVTPADGGQQGTRGNLDKGRVSLRKQQSVSLVKTGAPPLRVVRMGLGWEPARRGADVDLDASVICFDDRGKDVEKVWYGNLRGLGGAVQHSGDNLTGEGSGDDEVITVDLSALPAGVEALVFTANSFRGQKFTELKAAYCRLLDDRGTELVRYDLADTEPRTGVLLCTIAREPDGSWSMTALGQFHDGRNVKKMVNPARASLGWR